jgi:LysR family nitrogen assimilation transcriptional regulator
MANSDRYPSAMDLRQISYFVQVANLRSFSRAAEALNIAQSALSRHVQALEAELNCQLLFRTTRGVELTDAGTTLLTMGEALLAQAEDIKTTVQRGHEAPSGNVVVGLPPSVAAVFASRLSEEVHRAYPDITLRIIEGLGWFLEEWLRQGKIDLAVLTDFGDDTNLAMSRLAREEMVLVAGPSTWPHEQSTITLAEASQLELTTTHGFRTVVDKLIANTGIKLRYVEEFDSIPVIIERILSHPLATILPRGYMRHDEATGRLRVLRITDPGITRDLLLANNPRRARTAAMQAVGRIIRSRILDVVGA